MKRILSFRSQSKKVPRTSPKPETPTQRQIFVHVAKQNETIFENLIASNERVKSTYDTAHLYDHTIPLEPLETEEFGSPPPKVPVKVVPLDTFDCAEKLNQLGLKDIACLSMANAFVPGGAYLEGSSAQEEALCRRSTLYLTIRPELHLHPIPDHGGIYSPDVCVFRKSDDNQCELLEEQDYWYTSVISVAGISRPALNADKTDYAKEEDRESTRERIKTILRIAALEKRKNLVLGALGAGAFRNPTRPVANLFREVLLMEEFQGRFDGIWFAVYDKTGVSENYTVFFEVLDGLEV